MCGLSYSDRLCIQKEVGILEGSFVMEKKNPIVFGFSLTVVYFAENQGPEFHRVRENRAH